MNVPLSQPARILIVSNHSANCNLLEKSLADEEFHVRSFCNARVAVKCVPDVEPDLIVLDLSSAGPNSQKVCRQLKDGDETRNIPVLILTFLHEFREIEQAVAAGCDDFLTLPPDEPELRTRIRALIRVKRLREESDRLRDHWSD